jgi:hypothetical protein
MTAIGAKQESQPDAFVDKENSGRSPTIFDPGKMKKSVRLTEPGAGVPLELAVCGFRDAPTRVTRLADAVLYGPSLFPIRPFEMGGGHGLQIGGAGRPSEPRFLICFQPAA